MNHDLQIKVNPKHERALSSMTSKRLFTQQQMKLTENNWHWAQTHQKLDCASYK
jgi:hypothetical protein